MQSKSLLNFLQNPIQNTGKFQEKKSVFLVKKNRLFR